MRLDLGGDDQRLQNPEPLRVAIERLLAMPEMAEACTPGGLAYQSSTTDAWGPCFNASNDISHCLR